MLKLLHERFPLIPVYLLSFLQRIETEEERSAHEGKDVDQNVGICGATIMLDGSHGETSEAVFDDEKQRRPIDDELFLACVQAGGARGLVSTDFGVGKDRSHGGSAR